MCDIEDSIRMDFRFKWPQVYSNERLKSLGCALQLHHHDEVYKSSMCVLVIQKKCLFSFELLNVCRDVLLWLKVSQS